MTASPHLPPLVRVINAWGTATPFGVSRADPKVAEAVAAMLQRYVVMDQLQAVAGERLARWSGAQAACVTHCTAAGVTLSVAACMAGTNAAHIAQLPDAQGMPSRVLMLAAHQVNYGHPIAQAVRLAGARLETCASPGDVSAALAQPGVACVLAVESHLASDSGAAVTARLLALAREAGVPLVLDAAAQDWRVRELVASGADLVLASAQKYLRAPTAGLVMGRAPLVAAVNAQHAGIGRAMKPTKEAIAGVLAALDAREALPEGQWLAKLKHKVDVVAAHAKSWKGVTVSREPDPQGNGFDRLWLAIDPRLAPGGAAGLVQRLRAGDPVVAVAPHRVAQGQIGLELSGVDSGELDELCRLICAALQA